MSSRLILAHGVGAPFESPLPLYLYLGAAAATVLVSFAIRALVPDRDRARRERRLVGPQGVTVLVRILQAVALLFFFLTLISGAVIRESGLTFAPLAFWVGLIVGGTALSVVLGGIWPRIDPWGAVERTYRIKDVEPEPRIVPWWLGPLLVYLLFWFELVSEVGFDSFWIVIALVAYSLYVFTFRAGMGERWAEADPLSILFGFASRTSPLRVSEDGVYARGILGGLDEDRPMPLALYASVFILLASTTLDNIKETIGWSEFITRSGLDAIPEKIVNSVALLAFAAPFFAAFMLATWLAHRWTAQEISVSELGRRLGWSLIPIGVAYVLAHNASLIMTGGPQLIRALSDPFLKGWNLFGTADMFHSYEPSAKLVWFLEIALIVGGHVMGVIAAHRTAFRFAGSQRAAVRSEIPLTVMMAIFTITTLWLLAQPLVVVGGS